jgi:hypothetical protein
MRLKDGIDIASRPAGVVRQRHRRAAEHIEVGNDVRSATSRSTIQYIKSGPRRVADAPLSRKIGRPVATGHGPERRTLF